TVWFIVQSSPFGSRFTVHGSETPSEAASPVPSDTRTRARDPPQPRQLHLSPVRRAWERPALRSRIDARRVSAVGRRNREGGGGREGGRGGRRAAVRVAGGQGRRGSGSRR